MSIPYRNILIIKPGAVGDLLQMTPVIRALKQAAPDASITVMVGSSGTADLFRFHPAVARVTVYDRHADGSIGHLLCDLRRSRFDLVLNFQRSNLRTWFFVAACLPKRVLVYHKTRTRPVHAAVNYLETLSPLGIGSRDTGLDLYPGDEAARYAGELFSRPELLSAPVVALNPGATHDVNRWPPERFAELADLLSEKLGVRSMIIGGPGDTALANKILGLSRSRPLDLSGRTTLLQLGAVLKRCAAAVSGDTGPLHMATAVGTPVVALFGAADPSRTGPLGTGHAVIRAEGVQCVPCRSRSCANSDHLACMKNISAQQVLEALQKGPLSRLKR